MKNHYGQHRNAELAERHRSALERELGMDVEITARRNARGSYSVRGQYFTFTAVPPEEKDFDELNLDEYERFMDDYEGETEEIETESSGDYNE